MYLDIKINKDIAMHRSFDLALTARAPVIWGSSYIVTTQLLPNLDPLTISFLRALPAGVFLLCLVRQFPKGHWVAKMFVLGALNFSIFWSLLFFAAYDLPGGGQLLLAGHIGPDVVASQARELRDQGTGLGRIHLGACVP